MPRVARLDLGGYPYHVINRAVMRLKIFDSEEDYLLFEKILWDAAEEVGMRILAYCIMPNHWHLLLYPENDGDLRLFMHRLTNAHTRQVHARTRTIGTGPLYQGRYKSFIIEEDVHLLTVLKYVERNAVRAKLSNRVESWRWGSAWRRVQPKSLHAASLSQLPAQLPDDYIDWINTPERTEELDSIRQSVHKARPYGNDGWVEKIAKEFGLSPTLRNPGRPLK